MAQKILDNGIILDKGESMKNCQECRERIATRKSRCHKCYQRAWMKKRYNSPKQQSYRKKWREKNRERIMWLAAKHRAKRSGLEFSIEISDIAIPKMCPVFGTKLIWAEGRDTCPSLDRKNNSVGYTKENIRVISNRANQIKNCATVEEIKAVLEYMNEAA